MLNFVTNTYLEKPEMWKDYIIPIIIPIAASLISIAGTYWYIFKPQFEKQQENFLKQQKEEREKWIKDVYVRKEAEYWLEYREKFYKLTEQFLWFIQCFIEKNEEKGFLLENHPQDFVKKRVENWDNLLNLTYLMKPYIDKNENIEYERLRKMIWEITTFHNSILEDLNSLEMNCSKIYFEELTDEFEKAPCFNYKITNPSQIKQSFYFRMTQMYEHINYDPYTLEDYENSIKVLTEIYETLNTDISKINETLNDKITSQL